MVKASSRSKRWIEEPAGGLGQLTLVEHALCPLDTRLGLSENRQFEYDYHFVDRDRRCRSARARIQCPEGLSPSDEFYLWGLLAITLSQAEPRFDFHATPHYCLRQLGAISGRSRGGKNFELFRESLRRLAAVRYQNDNFYDPVRREHRRVSFGILSYSLPLDPTSSRAWRLVWDPLFFEFCQANGGRLRFDLDLYRSLDFASRRLFLLLHKVFWRRTESPRFDIRHLAVNVLGFSPTLPTRAIKEKIRRCMESLADARVIRAKGQPAGSSFRREAIGEYSVRFTRGAYFDAGSRNRRQKRSESPLHEPLRAIGFDASAIRRILSEHPVELVQVWSDVTLAAIERKGPGFFRRSPQAFFVDNITSAARRGRTPPDWFQAIRKAEEQICAKRGRRIKRGRKPPPCGGELPAAKTGLALSPDLSQASLVTEMTAQFVAAGQSPTDAQRNARRFALEHDRKTGQIVDS